MTNPAPLAAVLTLTVLVGLSPKNASAADVVAASDLSAEPFSVFVAQAHTHLRCGPGADFYRTDPLRRGQVLDVYLETDDGWLGVRPPEDSFSWIPADDVEVEPNGETGLVTQDRSVVWIGTHLGRARRYRWQVQLPKGEPVTILGRSEREGPDGPKQWFRIVPPSGEFRWIHQDDVVESGEDLIAMMEQSTSPSARRSQPDGGATEPTEKNNIAAIPKPQPLTPQPVTPRQPSYSETPDLVPRQVGSHALAAAALLARENQARSNGDPGTLTPMDSAPELQPIRSNPNTVDSLALTQQDNPSSIRKSAAEPAALNPIGSGLRKDAAGNVHESPSLGQNEFSPRYGNSAAVILNQPRLLDSSSVQASMTQPVAPRPDEIAGDSNWVVGVRAGQVAQADQSESKVQQSTHLEPIKTHDLTHDLTQGATPSSATTLQASSMQTSTVGAVQSPLQRTVNASRVEAVREEARTADLARLQLLFSRLIASSASEMEIEPIERAAIRLAEQSTDPRLRARASVLLERARQYRGIAQRRDGSTVLADPSIPRIPASASSPFRPASARLMPGTAAASAVATGSSSTVPPSLPNSDWVEGTLVQVYSARDHHPPYALTDNTGRTIAYVTPNPGLNLRSHLNSEIRVTGNHGFLAGMKTPHVLVTKAVRVTEGMLR